MTRFRRGVSSPADQMEVTSVEVAPGTGDEAVLRLAGRWQGAPAAAGAAPVLQIDDGMRTHRFTAIAGADVPRAPSDPPDTWRAAFAVPAVLLDIPEASFSVEAAGALTRVPRPADGEAGDEAEAGADRAVLAERRARRAELAEEAQTRRAAEARAEAAAARSDLETLQRDLDSLSRARGEAERRLAESERGLRAARQEAFAAEQARIESVEDTQERMHALERERDDLREELRATSDRVRELEHDLEGLSRRAAEAERAAEGAGEAPDEDARELRRALEAAELRAQAAAREVEDRRVELRAMIAAARRDRVDLAEAASTARALAEAETRRREQLERRVAELEPGAGEALRGQAEIAEAALRAAEEAGALFTARDAELARRVTELEEQVARAVEGERRVQEELDAVRRAAEELAQRAAAVAAGLAEAREAGTMLRAERDQAERRVSELAERLAAAREEGGRDRDNLEEARSVARTHAAQLQHVRLRVSELEREREAARERAAEAERTTGVERDELEQRVRDLDTRLEIATEGERESRAEVEELTAARDAALARVAELDASERVTTARLAELDAELARVRAAYGDARTTMTSELRLRAGVEAKLDEQLALAGWTEMVVGAQSAELERLRRRRPEPAPQEPPKRRRRRKEAEAEAETATPEPSPLPLPRPLPAQPKQAPKPWLPVALQRMAKDDPRAAAALIVALAPAQALAVEGRLTYDLTIDELGTYRVTLEDGRGTAAPLLATAPAGGAEVAFRLAGSAESLASAIAEAGPRRLFRRRRARIRGHRKQAWRLLAVHGARLGLPEVARGGVWIDPGLIYKALAYAIDPAWTAGARFAVAHAIEGPGGGTWYVIARGGGERLSVTRDAPPDGADATVHTTTAAFTASLAGDPAPAGEQPWVSGDIEAVKRLKMWTEWAQQGGRPAS